MVLGSIYPYTGKYAYVVVVRLIMYRWCAQRAGALRRDRSAPKSRQLQARSGAPSATLLSHDGSSCSRLLLHLTLVVDPAEQGLEFKHPLHAAIYNSRDE